MKAISLWQPWATLITTGHKGIETRSWSPPDAMVGERVAIHAAKTTAHLNVCDTEPFARCIPDPGGLALGAIIGTALLYRVGEMTEHGIANLLERNPREYAFGLYEPGRFAWVLREPLHLPEPIPYRGRQRIFNVPDELLPDHPPARERTYA